MKKVFFIILFMMSTLSSINAQTIVQTQASDVTIFINGAQVTRQQTIALPAGQTTIKFVDLSPFLDEKSIQVRASQGVTILSVNRLLNYTDSEKLSTQINTLQQQREQIIMQIKTEQANKEVLEAELKFLNSNQNISGKEQAVSASLLKETLTFYRERVAAIKKNEIEIDDKINKLETDFRNIELQIAQQTGSKQEPMSEILVELTTKSAGNYSFLVSYYVANAGWFPSYDIRSNSITEPIELIYKANVRQNTKENWKNVQLRLSSTNPTSGNVAPRLKTYFLNYGLAAPRYNAAQEQNQISGIVLDANTREPLAGVSITIAGTTIGTITDQNGKYDLTLPNNATKITAAYVGYSSQTKTINGNVQNFYLSEYRPAQFDMESNGMRPAAKVLSRSVSCAQLECDEISESGFAAYANIVETEQTEQALSFEVELKIPYTLPSGNKSTTAEIGIYKLPTEYIYYCVPKIDKDAFLVAKIDKWQQYNLLEGEANIFFENTFVGKSVLNLSQATDTLTLSLGRDKNINIQRENQIEFTQTRILSSKKETTRSWKINIQNNKKQDVNLCLYDQIPISTNSNIEVIVEEISGGKLDNATGEICWHIALKSSERTAINLRYKAKYQKDKVLHVE